MGGVWHGPLERVDDYRWKIPQTYLPGMRVPGIIYADNKLIEDIKRDNAPQQVANAACLPGIVRHSLAMPDIHWGYGLPIGGVVATDIEAGGVITPGGVGFDINCGVRIIRTDLKEEEVRRRLDPLVVELYNAVPAGVGSKGNLKLKTKEETKILTKGAAWAVERGYGAPEDLDHTEERGSMEGADPSSVSERAYERGLNQSGTLGSGNHFIEVQAVDEIYNTEAASHFGLDKGSVTVMIHTGSRGFGHQICTDYSKEMVLSMPKYDIKMPDRQLACVPVKSPEGKEYISAMKCAANYAWNNRQCLMHIVREVFERVFGTSYSKLGMELIWDVAHNIAKFEHYEIDGEKKFLCVHRKGATRAFGPGNPELPGDFAEFGQPVIIPGDMGRNSYILLGTKKSEEEAFGSTCHGAGRRMSRKAAMHQKGRHTLLNELQAKGIKVMAASRGTIAEEAPYAYKDVNEIVDVVHNAGISKKVCRMRPVGVIKG